MSDRGKIRARRVTGNCAQHQRDVATAIKTARELALLPYTQRTVSERGPGRGRAGREERGQPVAEAEAGDETELDEELEEGEEPVELEEIGAEA
jgi:small subunit ribosomal protein S18